MGYANPRIRILLGLAYELLVIPVLVLGTMGLPYHHLDPIDCGERSFASVWHLLARDSWTRQGLSSA